MDCNHKYTVEGIRFKENRVKIKCINCGDVKVVSAFRLDQYPMYPPIPKKD